VAALLARCGLSPELPFVVPRAEAPWIMAPAPVSAALMQWGEARAPVTSFTRRFEAAGEPGRLRIRTLGDARVFVNGRELASLARRGRRGLAEAQIDLPAGLAPGANELRVDVSNRTGPGLLSVAGPAPLATGAEWWVAVEGGRPAAAVPADDTRRNPLALAVETPLEALRQHGDALLACFVLGAGILWLATRVMQAGEAGAQRAEGERRPARLAAWLDLVAPVLASAAWLNVFGAKLWRIPLAVGFDARHHVAYVEHLLESGSLPHAADGWSTYHPPLFYLLAVVASWLGGETALRALPFAAGLGVVWAAWWLARRLAPQPGAAALATLFAATLPVNLYTAAYFSNEALHAALAGAALAATTACLLARRTSLAAVALAAALFGLAALTKFTALLALPVAFAFLAAKLAWVERAGAGRTLGTLTLFACVCAALAGWFYARTWQEYGTPVMGNWALPGDAQQWWQQPGFHTPAYYLGFGEALVHPYLSGFRSFWDSVYSTFWGDGFVAGRTDPSARHDFWDYGFMSAGYLLALPATALLVLGAGRLASRALGDPEPRMRLAAGFAAAASWAVLLAFAALTAELPFFAQAKAAYLLMLTPPLAVAFALGFGAADAWLGRLGGTAARAALHGWLAAFAAALYLGFAA
jgi:hypothetical protein